MIYKAFEVLIVTEVYDPWVDKDVHGWIWDQVNRKPVNDKYDAIIWQLHMMYLNLSPEQIKTFGKEIT